MNLEERLQVLEKRVAGAVQVRDDTPGTEGAKSARRRHSIYLDAELMERVDSQFKQFRHEAYPQEITKSVFIEKLLERGLQDLDSVKAAVKAVSA